MLSIILIIISSSVSVNLAERNKLYERQAYIEETKAHNELFTTTGSIYTIMDETIAQYINEDRIFHPYSTDEYLPEDEQQRIVTEVSTKILEEMSPIMYNQLACFFDKDKITEIITRRVLTTVIGLSAEINHQVKIKNTSPKSNYNEDLNKIITSLY